MASGRCPGPFSINSIYRVNPFFHLTATTVREITIVNTYVKNNFILHLFICPHCRSLTTRNLSNYSLNHRASLSSAASSRVSQLYTLHCTLRKTGDGMGRNESDESRPRNVQTQSQFTKLHWSNITSHIKHPPGNTSPRGHVHTWWGSLVHVYM